MRKVMVTTRMAVDDVGMVKGLCKTRGENFSDFIRRAVRLELSRLSNPTENEVKTTELQ